MFGIVGTRSSYSLIHSPYSYSGLYIRTHTDIADIGKYE